MLSATQAPNVAATAASAAVPPRSSVRRPISTVAGWPAATPGGTTIQLPPVPSALMTSSVEVSQQRAEALPTRVRIGYSLGSLVTGSFGTVPGLLLLPYLTN